MAKLTINIGLPSSGKSTESEKQILAEDNTVRINKDLLRTMLHFDHFSGYKEGLTKDASRVLASHFLTAGINVIIDDTNLNPGTRQSLVDLAKARDAKIEYRDLRDVPVETCIERDQQRVKEVGKHVIQKMALQYLDYWKGERVVVCDLDGTLADCTHRQHFLTGEKKDWKGFFAYIPNDTLRGHVYDHVRSLTVQGMKLILVSARPETYRPSTMDWLKVNGVTYDALIMREAHDKRPDTEVKSDIYEKYLKQLDIVMVFDDRPAVIRMWQAKGLLVEDVGNGVEF